MKRRILFCSQWHDRYRSLVEGLLNTGLYEIYGEENFVKGIGILSTELTSFQSFLTQYHDPWIDVEAERRIKAMIPALTRAAHHCIDGADRYACLKDSRSMASELKSSLAETIHMIESFDSIQSAISPDLLLVDGPGIKQQAWLAAAKIHRIPSLEIYHGSIHVKPELLPQRQIQADFMAMGSALIKDVYVKLGLPPERLRITGLPAQQNSGLTHEEATQVLARKYPLDPSKKTVLLYTSYDSGDAFEFLFDLSTGYQVEILKQACRAVRSLNTGEAGGAQLIIKRHPTMAAAGCDDEAAYRYIGRQQGLDPILVDPNESNPMLLAACDAVMAVKFSSTISEALNAGKPVLLWPYSRDWLHNDMLNSGALIFVDDEVSLYKALNRCLNDTAYQQKIEDNRMAYLQKFPHVDSDKVLENLITFIDEISGRCSEFSNRNNLEVVAASQFNQDNELIARN